MSPARKIGGEMAWPENCVAARTTSATLWDSLKPHSLWLNAGRSALGVAMEVLRKTRASTVIWLPSFICPSVPTACARAGYTVRYYGLDERLSILPESLKSAEAGDAFLWVHYFGFLQNDHVAFIRAKGLWLIEDGVQAAFTEGMGTSGHLAFHSLRKFTPLPDGAWLGSDFPIEAEMEPADSEFLSERMEGKRLKSRKGLDADYLNLFERSESRLDADSFPRVISQISRRMLETFDALTAGDARRKNYLVLMAELKAFPGLRPIYPDLPPKTVPLGLPVAVSKGSRDTLRQFLANHGIFCPIHWRLLPGTPRLKNDAAWLLSEKIMTFPIDQRYTEQDMKFVASMLRKSQMVS